MGNAPPGPPPPSGERILRCKDLFMCECVLLEQTETIVEKNERVLYIDEKLLGWPRFDDPPPSMGAAKRTIDPHRPCILLSSVKKENVEAFWEIFKQFDLK